jgi:Kef-type K+ transport system membrane component KefB
LDNMWLIASIWVALALAASLVSIKLGLTVALMEIIAGIIGGNFLDLHATPWTDAMGNFGIVLLSFLAGAEIDPQSLRQNLKPSLSMGLASFLVPFIGVFIITYYLAHWEIKASLISGLALSTTSVAIVYTTLIENGSSSTPIGKTILAAVLITDVSTMLALGFFTVDVGIWLAIFAAVMVIALLALPKIMPWLNKKLENRLDQPYIKALIGIIFVLSWLATQAGSQAVLPAFLVGLVMAGFLEKHRAIIDRLQITTFTVLIPFYFLKAGSLLSLTTMGTAFGWILIFLILKIIFKFLGILPVALFFKWPMRTGINTSLLMSTGLTFGTISALFGLTNNIINQEQYTILLSAVIGSALIPSVIAQTWFKPSTTKKSPDTQENAQDA